jgi:hypothetical protein
VNATLTETENYAAAGRPLDAIRCSLSTTGQTPLLAEYDGTDFAEVRGTESVASTINTRRICPDAVKRVALSHEQGVRAAVPFSVAVLRMLRIPGEFVLSPYAHHVSCDWA